MIGAVPHLVRIDEVPENPWTPVARGDMTAEDFGGIVQDHYQTNPIARASQIMAELSRLAAARRAPPLAAE
jgi:NADH-quinone oxidoreductase subunit G